MLVAMSRLHSSGMPSLKPDAFTYTAVIDSWAKSGYRGAAARADQLLDKMEAKYLAGDLDLKPNTFTYNAGESVTCDCVNSCSPVLCSYLSFRGAVINALAKSGEPGAAARAERVLQNMVNRHRSGGGDDVKPTVRINIQVSHPITSHFFLDHQLQHGTRCVGQERRRPRFRRASGRDSRMDGQAVQGRQYGCETRYHHFQRCTRFMGSLW